MTRKLVFKNNVPICQRCKCKLIIGKTWTASRKGRRTYFCFDCLRHKRNKKITEIGKETYINGRKDDHLKRTYGISLKQYELILEKQNGVCKICGKKETVKNQYNLCRLSVEHCHKTGRIRGLVCWRCNIVISIIERYERLVEDNPKLYKKLRDYLLGQA